LTLHCKKYLPVFLLGFFSFFINYYYGFIGVMPMDNFVLYNGGYRVLNGYVPFTDYWLVTGPLLDYLNAFFFYVKGVSWSTYIIHSSLFNSILAIATFYLFTNLGLRKIFAFIYSAFVSILFYPTVGTPFVDHHATFFLLIAFYFFIFWLNKNNFYYILFIPLLFCLAFLSKQTPTAYGIIAFCSVILTYVFLNKEKNLKIITFFGLGSIISIIFLILFFYFTKIKIINFYDQYILFASSIGEFRFINYRFKIIDNILEFKFIFILVVTIVIIFIKMIKDKTSNLNNIFIIVSAITITSVLVFHQYYTLNQNYIFFLIPLLTGIFHAFYSRFFKQKFLLIFIISLCIFATVKYHIRFNENRKFNELEKVNIGLAVDAAELTDDLKGLKWITSGYPKNPKQEIQNLKEAMEIIAKEESNKAIITDYQFIAPALKIYDFSPNQWHHPGVSFPIKNQKYHEKYKNFFIQNLKHNKIDFIYEIIEDNNTITESVINKKCLIKKRITKILLKFEIKKQCKDFQ